MARYQHDFQIERARQRYQAGGLQIDGGILDFGYLGLRNTGPAAECTLTQLLVFTSLFQGLCQMFDSVDHDILLHIN